MTNVFRRAWTRVLLCAVLAAGAGCERGDGATGAADTTATGPVIEELTAARPDTAAGEVPLRAPDFESVTLAGERFHLGEHHGKVVLLNFWATWCAPCRIEIPDFIALQDELGDEGFQIVGIALDVEGEEVVRPYVEEMGINYPVITDIGEIAELYGGVYALPTSILIDRDGNLVRKVPGMLTEDLLRPILEDLLEGG